TARLPDPSTGRYTFKEIGLASGHGRNLKFSAMLYNRLHAATPSSGLTSDLEPGLAYDFVRSEE
ncbi:hypothetical protein, partial [Paludisphaera rhizosphaerae]|uniref:hypothetical protein n=1 Tax=Paludisphaera rhizosphaerae TaxID=2711216 RepID=UPI00197DE60C